MAEATHTADASLAGGNRRLQRWRRATQAGFGALFLLAPTFDLLRFDLHEAQLWFLGQRWGLGIDAFVHGQATAAQTAASILLRGFVPGIAFIVAFLAIAWRHGRLYCGWLCPHFSMVEGLNRLLQRACGRLSLWDREPTPRAGGALPDGRWWPAFALACGVGGVLWGITLLTYLLPPAEIWGGLWHGTLTPNQARFIAIASTVFALEFALARHLFCRFGCAVGLFQSLAWMANPRARVVGFDKGRARDCRSCRPDPADAQATGSACEQACPMRLQPRRDKRWMFSCVQCGQCLTACDRSQQAQARAPLLQWTVGADALRQTLPSRRAAAARAGAAGVSVAPSAAARTTPAAAPASDA